MSGHSKWHGIRHKKALVDAKRGKIFTKVTKEITVAAKLGGGDPNGNPRLRLAVERAKSVNMPKEKIERAIKKGIGELEGAHYEELTYEGFGPGGVAVLVEILTDNRNRAVSDIRHIFTKNNGKPAEAGSVSWIFEKKGVILFDRSQIDEDKVMEIALEAGAEDVLEEKTTIEVRTSPIDFEKVKKSFETNGLAYISAELSMIPLNTIKLSGKEAEQMLKLMELLTDNEDVQNVYANFDIPDDIIERLTS